MGWRISRGRDRDSAGRPINRFRASADGEGGGLSPEREQVIRTAVLSRAVEERLIPERDLDGWRRNAEADLWGVIELLNSMEAARREASGRNGDMAASAPRREPDAERLVASAIREHKFDASRADFWRERFRRDPQQTEAIIQTLQPLPPLQAASGAQPAPDEDASMIGQVSPSAAKRLGMAVQRPHPLGDNLPPRLEMPPPARRVHVVSDRS